MAAQDQLEDTKPNDSVTAGICCNSGSEQSENVLQLKELFSSESDQMPKARKPYTITKQREKWTEEEHQKFLEALKLYGRGWHKIQEHIGSKTAVQIRSHAQKFFSKVARESNGSAESSVKPIEIPPPRPKRKPMHPYPRKSVDILKGTPVSNQLERIPSPNLVVSEKENQSPTSVLYAVASDTLGSAISGQHNGCSSPASWTSDVHSMTLPLDEKENEHVISNLSAEEDKGYLSSAQLSFSPNLENFSSNDEACAKGDANSVPIRSIKLFGRTVLVSDSEKSYPPGAEDCLLETSKTDLRNSKFKKEKLVGSLPGKLDTEIPLGMVNTKTNLFSTVGPYCYQFTELHQKNVNCSETINPLTWPTFCQGMPFLHLTPDDSTSSLRRPIDSFVEERPKQKVLNEVSCTGSNDGSVSEVENRERNLEVVDSSRKGFVSYKRCLAKREVNSLVCTGEEREQQRARVCS